jgi:DNA adenine methylase
MIEAKPWAKSVGGKRKLLPEILSIIGPEFVTRWSTGFTFHEPFVGGGAVFFGLANAQARMNLQSSCTSFQVRDVRLADNNLALIATYKVIRDRVDALIDILTLSYPPKYANTASSYVSIRAEFNSFMNQPAKHRALGLAARFIVLNRLCFNGIWRVNSSGQFNVPFAHYDNPTICDADNLRACSRALQGVKLYAKDFGSTPVKHGDVVYCDPPYIPTNATSNFVGYTKEGFGTDDQVRLRDKAREWKKLGAFVLLSNSDTPMTRELYKGFTLKKVQAARSVNARGDGRGKVSELLIY